LLLGTPDISLVLETIIADKKIEKSAPALLQLKNEEVVQIYDKGVFELHIDSPQEHFVLSFSFQVRLLLLRAAQ
jgi:hypothetical protein